MLWGSRCIGETCAAGELGALGNLVHVGVPGALRHLVHRGPGALGSLVCWGAWCLGTPCALGSVVRWLPRALGSLPGEPVGPEVGVASYDIAAGVVVFKMGPCLQTQDCWIAVTTIITLSVTSSNINKVRHCMATTGHSCVGCWSNVAGEQGSQLCRELV